MTVAADPPYLLGIDIGTTNLKANLYDADGRRVAAAARPTVAERRHPRNPDWAEYSPDTLWQATVDNIREVVSQIPDAGQIKALAVVGMGEPIIPVDERGDWRYPAICWFDRRTEPQAKWWREHFGARRVYGITGQPVSFFLSLNAMLWLREHEPDVFRRAQRRLVVEDYVMFKLAGVYATDYSIASRTMGLRRAPQGLVGRDIRRCRPGSGGDGSSLSERHRGGRRDIGRRCPDRSRVRHRGGHRRP